MRKTYTKNFYKTLLIFLFGSSSMAFAEYVPKDTLIFSNPLMKYKEWFVNDVRRQACLYVPPVIPPQGVPLIFMYHGANNLIDKFSEDVFNMHAAWPEAMVIYPQGLVVSPGTSKNGTGFQVRDGQYGNTDLIMFDSMLVSLKKEYNIDTTRIYACGLSNGGGMMYFLWYARGDVFSAFAPCATYYAGSNFIPKPVMHIAGKRDDTVTFETQMNWIETMKKFNGCSNSPTQWNNSTECLEYPSVLGAPVVTYIHSYGHVVPGSAEAYATVFFKQHQKKLNTSVQSPKSDFGISAFYDSKNNRICLSNLPKNGATLKLTDSVGRVLSQRHSSETSIHFDMNKFDKSMYIVQVVLTDGRYTSLKVIKK